MNGSFERLYARFRSGKYFLYTLMTFCVCWVFFNWKTGFDPDFGLYNTMLSTEASLNGTVIVMMADKFEKWVREMLEWHKKQAKGLESLMMAQASEMDQVRELTEAVLDLLRHHDESHR